MLRWPAHELLPPAAREALIGPGAPFEMTREKVRGVEMTVFARRPPHVPALLASAAERFPDRRYLVFPDRVLTFAEVAEAAARTAVVLRERYGITRGDRIALVGANSAEYAITLWAGLAVGAITVGLNGWWTRAELSHGLLLTRPAALFGDARRLGRLDGAPELARQPVRTFSALVREASGDGVAAPGPKGIAGLCPDLGEDDPAAILFTSGTTGRPKGAVISHRALVNFSMDGALRGAVQAQTGAGRSTSGIAAAPGQVASDQAASGQAAPDQAAPPVSVLASPFFHISGIGPLLGSAPMSGLTLVFPPAGRWDPTVHLELTARHGVTNWTGVPTQYLRLLEHPDLASYDLSRLGALAYGGSSLPPELVRLLDRVLPGRNLSGGYGMTETCGIGSAISGALLRAHPTSVGVASPTAEIKVIAPDGTEIPDTGRPDVEAGEICIRCPSTFLGYWEDEAATAAVLDEDGWYRTGDFGRIVNGLLYMDARLRDLIIRGGENIYPAEIEHRLNEHPGIADAAVIGVPHRELGQEVMAVVVRREGTPEGAALGADDVRDWVAAALAHFKVPAHVRFVAELPYNATGKVLKHELERTVGLPASGAPRP